MRYGANVFAGADLNGDGRAEWWWAAALIRMLALK